MYDVYLLQIGFFYINYCILNNLLLKSKQANKCFMTHRARTSYCSLSFFLYPNAWRTMQTIRELHGTFMSLEFKLVYFS